MAVHEISQLIIDGVRRFGISKVVLDWTQAVSLHSIHIVLHLPVELSKAHSAG